MKVVLVSARRSPYTGEGNSAPHQGLLSLAAVLRQGTFAPTQGVEIVIIDDQLIAIEKPWAPTGYCLAEHVPDLLGVQATSSSLNNALKLLAEVEHRFPNALRVLGGVGADCVAEQTVASGAADVVVYGEAEVSFSNLVYQFGSSGRSNFRNVPGIVWMNDDGDVTRNPAAPLIQDLDRLPPPARDLVDMKKYRQISPGRAGNLITSRGCSYACAYCYSRHHWGLGQRIHSVKRVVAEILQMYEQFGIDRIRIEDDDFLENTDWVTEFCGMLIRNGLSRKVDWEMKARPDLIDSSIVRMLRNAGCFRILMGVETLDAAILRRLSRGLKVERVQNALTILREGGIGVQATLILGIPGETATAMRETLMWLERILGDNQHDIVSPCFFVPFTPAVSAAMRRRYPFRLEVQDSDCLTGHIPVTSSDTCSFDELNDLYIDMAPTRRGAFPRIAHLATPDDVRTRLAEVRPKSEVAAGARW